MNSALKLKHCPYLLWRFHQRYFQKNLKTYLCIANQLQLNQPHFQVLESKKLFQNSFYSIREYAKRAQGRTPKSGRTKALKLTDEEMADVINIEDYRFLLSKVVEKLKKEYVDHLSIHSASVYLESILVKIGEDEFPLNEIGEISKKNPNLIAINMSNFPEGIKPALQAILENRSDLNPQQDGTMLYLTIPKVTREYRESLAKSAKTFFNKAKDEIRAIQNTFVKVAKSKSELSEDLVFSTTNQIMLIAEQTVADLEKILKAKQKELVGES